MTHNEEVKKINLKELGIRAGSLEADLAMKLNELIEAFEDEKTYHCKKCREQKKLPNYEE